MRIERSIPSALAVVLMERVPNLATLSSTPTLSTPDNPFRNFLSAESLFVASRRIEGSTNGSSLSTLTA